MKKRNVLLLLLTVACGSVFAYTQQDLLSAQYDYQVSSDQLTQAKNNLKDASSSLIDAQQDRNKAYEKYMAAESSLVSAKKAKADAESAVTNKTEAFAKANDKVNQIWDSLNKPSN